MLVPDCAGYFRWWPEQAAMDKDEHNDLTRRLFAVLTGIFEEMVPRL
jgi:hypothetical protein